MFWIKKININNFRSIENRSFLFDKHINLLYGPNGVGKTSIIEAVGYTCLGKSIKKAKDKDVLKFDKPYFNIIRMQRELEEYNRQLQRTINAQVRKMHEQQHLVIFALAKMAEGRDKTSENHAENVGKNARMLAMSLQFSPKFAREITN